LEAREHDPTLRVPEYKKWEDDPAERARRIWLWWRIRVYEVQEFQFIPLALRLVALVQPSSCGIERVFSQLKLILDACGENVLVGGEPKAFFIVFAIWEPFMAQSQDRVDGVCDWS
jgi:hypothetical protein